MAKKQTSKIQPAEQVRIGSVKAAIWRNETEKGTFFNVTFERLYKIEEGQWQSANSFGRDDLLLLAKVANATHTRILELIAAERRERATA